VGEVRLGKQRYQVVRANSCSPLTSADGEQKYILIHILTTGTCLITGWINDTMRMQATNPNFFGKINYDHKLVYSIHHDLFDVPYDENRTFAPSWYNSPGT
jgi:hypothetical protein